MRRQQPLPTSATFLRPSRATGTAIARPGQIVHGLFEQIAGGLGGPSCLERFGRLQNGAGGLRGSAVSEGCLDRKSTRLNSSHLVISYAVFCLQKKNHTPSLA